MTSSSREELNAGGSLGELDESMLGFIRILEKHARYAIAAGYVSTLFGSARATQGLDVFIRELSRDEFSVLYEDLMRQGYECLNAGEAGELYAHLDYGLTVRFALKDKVIPNFEVKFARERLEKEAVLNPTTIETKLGRAMISTLE
jgi:hypothetical protein